MSSMKTNSPIAYDGFEFTPSDADRYMNHDLGMIIGRSGSGPRPWRVQRIVIVEGATERQMLAKGGKPPRPRDFGSPNKAIVSAVRLRDSARAWKRATF